LSPPHLAPPPTSPRRAPKHWPVASKCRHQKRWLSSPQAETWRGGCIPLSPPPQPNEPCIYQLLFILPEKRRHALICSGQRSRPLLRSVGCGCACWNNQICVHESLVKIPRLVKRAGLSVIFPFPAARFCHVGRTSDLGFKVETDQQWVLSLGTPELPFVGSEVIPSSISPDGPSTGDSLSAL